MIILRSLILGLCLLALSACGANVTLAWTAPNDPFLAGYDVSQGVSSGSYTNTIRFGNATSCTISNLVPNTTYFFAVRAFDSNGLESPFSNEVTYTPGVTGLPQFTLQPIGGTNNYGSPKTLTGNAGTNVVYQWNFSGQPISGATTTSLTLSFLTWTNNGTYNLAASNAFGVVLSSPALIAVTPPPVSNVRVTGP